MLESIHVATAQISGLDAHPLTLHFDRNEGGFVIDISGITDAHARELRVRVLSALDAAGVRYPGVRVRGEVLRGHRVALDLPVAVGIMAMAGEVPPDLARSFMFHGQLNLDGRITPAVGGATASKLAESCGVPIVVAPEDAARCRFYHYAVYRATWLSELLAISVGAREPEKAGDWQPGQPEIDDLAVIGGGLSSEDLRKLTVAAVARIPLLLTGPVGIGKTMYARRLPMLLPPMTVTEAKVATRIYDAGGLLYGDSPTIAKRPFRAPHHSASRAALFGGGSLARAGEVSLAHAGVLYLDDVPEFRLDDVSLAINALHDGWIRIGRDPVVKLPSQAWLVGSANLCQCGRAPNPECRCSDRSIERYLERLDKYRAHFALEIEIPTVTYESLRGDVTVREKPLLGIAEAVTAARVFSRNTRRTTVAPDWIRANAEDAGVRLPYLWGAARAIADLSQSESVDHYATQEALGLLLF